VTCLQLPVDTLHYTLAAVDGPSVVIVLSGSAKASSCSLDEDILELKRGSVVFISAMESLELTIESSDTETTMFRAFCAAEK